MIRRILEPPVHPATLAESLRDVNRPLALRREGSGFALVEPSDPDTALVPAIDPKSLGDSEFRREHGLEYAYVTGSMANGIASVELVESVTRAGMLGFFGAAGLSLGRIGEAIDRLTNHLGPTAFGVNLIHTPNEPTHEAATVDLFLRRGLPLIEASAYLDLTLPVVRYRLSGLARDPDGRPRPRNRIVAKVSRVEVARKFFAPPPEAYVNELRLAGEITPEQAELARRIPMATDVTVESDSGGHTDNRPLVAQFPTIAALRDRMQREYEYDVPLRLGAAGGIATPAGVVAAFALGAAYVVTGSINQACVESGSSDLVRKMLAEAEQADVTMAPAADMFEMGVQLQVLKRGTMFPMRARKLYELYRTYPSLEAIPEADRANLEKTIFRLPIEEVWRQTREFWQGRDPSQVERAETDARHRMALVFRWYLGLSSRWANAGVADRRADFQVWAGPAMGAFNEWTKGTPLERPENRLAAEIGRRLMHEAAILTRLNILRAQGINVRTHVG